MDAEENVRSKFDRRRTRYSIDRVVSADMPWEKLCEIMHSYTTVVLMPMEKELRRRIMDDCFWHGIAIMLKPDMQDIMVNCADTVIMSDVPLCAVHTGNYDRGYLTAKRVLDIVASVCGLILCSPIFLAVAIAIKIQDGGPVFYRQKRLTLNGKPFYLTKFRSMVVNAESATGAVLAGKSDSRITKVGAFLRATRIDELPQLLNILNGDMTLVGPRPERPEFYQKYCAEYPEFAYRLRAKAGLTGYAQLYGKYNTTFADKALLDMYYIQKASFLWDLQLIFYTLKIIFVKESTEGVETKPAEPEATPLLARILPGIRTTIVLMAVMNLGNILNAGFDQVYNLYSASVYATGDILDTYVYRVGLQGLQYSFGTAVGLLKSVIAFVLMIGANKLAQKYTDSKIF